MNRIPHMASGCSTPEAAIEALYALGHSLLGQERFRDSSAVFRLMLQVAPEDERSWLGLGACHEGAGQNLIALELYGAGGGAIDSVRCHLARFRILHDLDRITEADEAFDAASLVAGDDDELTGLIVAERSLRP